MQHTSSIYVATFCTTKNIMHIMHYFDFSSLHQLLSQKWYNVVLPIHHTVYVQELKKMNSKTLSPRSWYWLNLSYFTVVQVGWNIVFQKRIKLCLKVKNVCAWFSKTTKSYAEPKTQKSDFKRSNLYACPQENALRFCCTLLHSYSYAYAIIYHYLFSQFSRVLW